MANRKLTLFLTLAIFVSVSVVAVSAQSTITLGPSSMQWTFLGTGSSTSIGLMPCNNRGCGGTASGTGQLASGPSFYQLVPGGTDTLTLTNAALGTWTVSGPAVGFTYGKNLLTGTLDLLNLQELPGGNTGSFDYTGTADLVVTGGSLAGVLAGKVVMTVNMMFNSDINLENLLGSTAKRWARVTGGQVLASPEPSSIFLLGSGMLAMGSMLRLYGRRKRPPSVTG